MVWAYIDRIIRIRISTSIEKKSNELGEFFSSAATISIQI